MARFYNKLKIIIRAEQWHPDSPVEGVLQPPANSSNQFIPHLFTGDDDVTEVSPGDWIVVDSIGERYCYSDRTFRQTYTPVNDEAAKSLGWDDLEDYSRRQVIYLETDSSLELS